MASLIRFWFEFDPLDSPAAKTTPRWGVTAWTVDDARNLILESGRFGQSLPPITRLVEDVDISTLDENHVLPNMAPPNERCIWYPLGYQQPHHRPGDQGHSAFSILPARQVGHEGEEQQKKYTAPTMSMAALRK
jgi:hypothetical protein